MNPTKTFRLTKTTRRLMATITSAEARGEFKRIMIQAQLASQVVIKREKADAKSAQ